MKGLINIQIEDKESSRWSLVRHLNCVKKNQAKVRNFNLDFAKKLSFKGTKFLAHKKDYIKIET